MSIKEEATAQLARQTASALDLLICTGLTKFLGRPILLEDALKMAEAGRIASQAHVSRPNDVTYFVDGKPFLFVGEMQMRHERSEDRMSYKMVVDQPYRFIPPKAPDSQA